MTQLFMDIAGTQLTAEDRFYLQHSAVGGLILFSRNFKSYEQLQALLAEVKALCQHLIIAVDHEGGRVQRFREGFTRIPAMAKFGQLYQQNPAEALQAVYAVAYLLASELIAVGIDLNLGPVLDIDYGHNQVIADRAFAGSIKTITKLCTAYQQGLQAAGMQAVAKHFPGHGYVYHDSHVACPRDERSLMQLLQSDITPFAHFIKNGGKAIMPSHVLYRVVDSEIANFSEKWLKTILKKRLGFAGIIISDDLHMQAATNVGRMPARVQRALRAGCDIVLICNDRQGLIQTCSALPALDVLDLSCLRAQTRQIPTHQPLIEQAKYWIKRVEHEY